MRRRPFTRAFALAALCVVLGSPQAALVTLSVNVQNVAPANGIAFAPLHVGFGQGIFDAFDTGGAATAPIISVAEGGSGSAWQPAFAAAEPLATRGVISTAPFLSGAMASQIFTVDTALNPFFTFASMVVPSNDFFIGNDSPTQYRLFDSMGNLLLTGISQFARDIWDAGSELFDPAAAAFVGNNDLRTPQGGVVTHNFSELAGFDGLMTAAGYVFNSGLSESTEVYRIRFEVLNAVPEPATPILILMTLSGLAWLRRRAIG
jgi:hypothetical protein